MKINREARQKAKQAFKACLTDGFLDPGKLKSTIDHMGKAKGRNYLAVLARLKQLVALEVKERTLTVTTSTPLSDEGASVFNVLEKKLGPALAKSYRVDNALLGGLRIQWGSNVWDGSIRKKLNDLEANLAS